MPEYKRILVPVRHTGSERAVTTACRLAAERGATVTALAVIEVPAELPLDAHMFDEEAEARRLLAEAESIGDLHDVTVVTRTVRARGAGPAIVRLAQRESSEIIVLRSPRRTSPSRRGAVFGRTTSFVLENAPCRVLVSAAEQVQASRRHSP